MFLTPGKWCLFRVLNIPPKNVIIGVQGINPQQLKPCTFFYLLRNRSPYLVTGLQVGQENIALARSSIYYKNAFTLGANVPELQQLERQLHRPEYTPRELGYPSLVSFTWNRCRRTMRPDHVCLQTAVDNHSAVITVTKRPLGDATELHNFHGATRCFTAHWVPPKFKDAEKRWLDGNLFGFWLLTKEQDVKHHTAMLNKEIYPVWKDWRENLDSYNYRAIPRAMGLYENGDAPMHDITSAFYNHEAAVKAGYLLPQEAELEARLTKLNKQTLRPMPFIADHQRELKAAGNPEANKLRAVVFNCETNTEFQSGFQNLECLSRYSRQNFLHLCGNEGQHGRHR